MSTCTVHDAGSIELYFYGELTETERAAVADHLRRCRVCAAAHDELKIIRTALSARPDVSAPPAGIVRRRWSIQAFMTIRYIQELSCASWRNLSSER